MAAAWKGTISFGLVSIPVELHPAVRDTRPHFHFLHAKDRSPVSYERVCRRERKPVAWEDVVKGYEYTKGKFVILTKEDFQKAALERSRTVEILDFVEAEAVDDRFFDNSYYAVPRKGDERGYAVLREGIRESGRIGIGKIVLRERQHLAGLTVVENALVLTTMRFADEVADVKRSIFPEKSRVRPKELRMAKMLIDGLAAPWQPEKYEDDYRKNLDRIIRAKMRGGEPRLEAEKTPRDAKVLDLMEKLRQSLGGERGAGRRTTGSRRRRQRAA